MSEDPTKSRRLLAFLGTAMIATGQPVSEIEDDLAEVGIKLGYPDVQMAGSPTGITLSLGSGEPATFESVNTPLRLDQSAEVRTIRHQLLDGTLDASSATEQLQALRRRPRRYPQWTADLGLVVASTGICLILQPGWPNVLFSALAAILVAGLLRLAGRFSLIATLLPALAAFVVGCGLFAAADAGLLDGALRTALPPLAVLLPGALIVTAMSELAAGDMVAGSSRLLFGLVQLMLFTLGLVAASQLFSATPEQLTNMRLPGLGWWAAPAGLVLISIGLTLIESPPLRLVPWIFGVLSLALVAQTLGSEVSGAFGSFVGAFAASLGSYLVEAIKPSLPRLVVFLPAFWLLVPGSLGLLSTTQLAVDPASSASAAVRVAGIISALALGLLVGTATAQSIRGVLRRTRRQLT